MDAISGSISTPEFVSTPLEEIPKAYDDLAGSFRTGLMYPLSKRKQQLAALARMLVDNVTRWRDALYLDVGKPHFQGVLFEVSIANQAVAAIKELDVWAAPIKPDVKPHNKILSPTIYKSPKGVVLIISPWNYPITLTMQPLVSALAAGNCAILKPSELAPNVSALMAELCPKYFDPGVVRVVNGGVPETTRLLELRFDHIFYTGNGLVGRIIAAAAAKHLTPVTLELGGKSPVVVDPENLDAELVARRILWGKLCNAGQICVSPDYILAPASAQPALIAAMKKVLREFFPDDGDALNSSDLGRIVNDRHFHRVTGLLKESKGELLIGEGKTDPSRFAIEPVVIKADKSDPLMREEIFGPVLPLVTVKDMDDAIDFINNMDHPLALYVFTNNEEVKGKFVASTRSGSLVFNDTISQLVVPELPFGGFGASGYGVSVGRWGYEQFTHFRSSIDAPPEAEAGNGIRYPPYTKEKMDIAHVLALPAVPEF